MRVYLERLDNSIFVMEASTHDVICNLPNIMQKQNMPQILKAVSILLKGMSNESRKIIKRNAIKPS